MNEWPAVQELYRKKVPKLQIANQLGISRNTVKRLIKLKEEPKYTREYYATKIDPYILAALALPTPSLVFITIST
ncbi:MAG: helix-turn-helix domain-containing protein [Tissierella sp.]|nr:helix-turn-helix domain-containing protein [Tissierella sp.]